MKPFVSALLCAVVIAVVPVLIVNPKPATRTITVSEGNGGWWSRIDKPGRMDRGPYPYRWMAERAFPIQRWTW